MKTGCINCMEIRIGDRSPVGRLSRTWLRISQKWRSISMTGRNGGGIL